MPSLKDMLSVKSLSGFAPSENPTKGAPQVTGTLGENPYRRCPLPPFSATVDTLRQFDESGKVPARRVIPLPIQTIAAAGGNIVTNVTTSSSGSGGSSSGGGSTTPTLVAATASLTVPSLSPGQVFTATATLAKSFQLLLLTATNALEVRMYGSSLAQTIDIARSPDTAPAFETTQGLITDVIFDTAPFQWAWQNRIAANADSPQSKTIYFTVVNPSDTGIGSSIITVTYVALET